MSRLPNWSLEKWSSLYVYVDRTPYSSLGTLDPVLIRVVARTDEYHLRRENQTKKSELLEPFVIVLLLFFFFGPPLHRPKP